MASVGDADGAARADFDADGVRVAFLAAVDAEKVDFGADLGGGVGPHGAMEEDLGGKVGKRKEEKERKREEKEEKREEKR